MGVGFLSLPFILSPCLTAAEVEEKLLQRFPWKAVAGGAVPAPATSHRFGLDCGFLGNHLDESKKSTHLTTPIKYISLP